MFCLPKWLQYMYLPFGIFKVGKLQHVPSTGEDYTNVREKEGILNIQINRTDMPLRLVQCACILKIKENKTITCAVR